MITRRDVAQKLEGYMESRISLDNLIDWAEDAIMDGELEPETGAPLRDVIARIGLADVREFGLTIADFQEMLENLGYRLEVRLTDLHAG